MRIDKKRLVPEDKGRVLTAFLNFFARYVEYDFTAALEEQLDRISNNEIACGAICCAISGASSPRPSATSRTCGSRKSSTRSTRCSARTSSRRAPTAPIRAKCPNCETGQLSIKLGKVRRLHRLHQLSGCRYTRQFAAGNGNGSPDGGMKKLGEDRDRPRGDAALGPFRPLSPAWRGRRGREAQARRPAERRVARRHRPRPGRSPCSRSRARSASTPTTASRSWPASAASAPTCSTARSRQPHAGR